ncbi:CHAT domain-containing tetratricopeptide repeat protein [Gloeobacter morelensis]|uniref:Tetratricopeptide repeat protein n=1 Tax=Gloeobacter morelensis MG652769 TaxID=2781736 RepID=A0ABY3PLE4_9CYAN|nr:CHAT domain-containing protein [Gloeobacter morelensis]UFP94467.1 tetratricopeptide repeat protein [Gloeobacter morelensis MG652769]
MTHGHLRIARHLLTALLLSATGGAVGTGIRAQPQEPTEVQQLREQAGQFEKAGQYRQAIESLQRVVSVQQQTPDPLPELMAASLRQLANLHRLMGEYNQAETFVRQAVALCERQLKPGHPEAAAGFYVLALVHRDRGDYLQAEPLLQRALAERERAFGAQHPEVARTLNSLANLYAEQGAYRQAEPLYRRTLAIWEQQHGRSHPQVASTLVNLALLYSEQGAYRQAEPLYRRALAIGEQKLGPQHPSVGVTLQNLAILAAEQGNPQEAETLFRRALAIGEQTFGPEHPTVAAVLGNLADLQAQQGDLEQAEPLYRRALAIGEQKLGPQHPFVADTLGNLARLCAQKGDDRQAEALFERAVAIWKKTSDLRQPKAARLLADQAIFLAAQNRLAAAVESMHTSLELQEANAALNLAVGSENRKRDYLALLQQTTDIALWLHLHRAPADRAAARLALDTLLRRKARLLDILSDELHTLRRRLNTGDRQLFDALADTRRRLAGLIFRGPGTELPEPYRDTVKALARQIDTLESQLAERSAAFRSHKQSAAVTVDTVAKAIPAGAVLIELAVYRPVDPQAAQSMRFGAPRYAAYLLSGDGAFQAVDLGAVAPVDGLVRPLRQFLGDPQVPVAQVRRIARQLHRRLMQPVVERLPSGTRHLLLSADGTLHLLPFAALLDERNRYLVEDFAIGYLDSGRELLRLGSGQPLSRQPPLILADPDYRRTGLASARRTKGSARTVPALRSVDLFRLPPLPPLPGTGREARKLASLLPDARVLTGRRATENILKQTPAPRILHLATHGFFLDAVTISGQAPPAVVSENPLLRSGLAMAGFDARSSAEEDGVLTALEVSSLDLQGTALVVLSACDTGLGQVQAGEGVYGLRRAFALAGAQSQLVSLWKVEDQATLHLMEAYYSALHNGLGRSEALRRAQLQLRAERRLEHPFYWAGFIPSGDWRPLPPTRRTTQAMKRSSPLTGVRPGT